MNKPSEAYPPYTLLLATHRVSEFLVYTFGTGPTDYAFMNLNTKLWERGKGQFDEDDRYTYTIVDEMNYPEEMDYNPYRKCATCGT